MRFFLYRQLPTEDEHGIFSFHPEIIKASRERRTGIRHRKKRNLSADSVGGEIMELIKVLLTTVLSAFVLFVITKLIGKKQFSQLDIFDYVTGITIGSIGAELATELEDPLKPLTAMIAWGAVSYILSVIEDKFNRSRKYINGSPCMLMNNGKLMRKQFAKSKIDLSEFLMTARQAGYFDLSEVKSAILEYNGKISFLPYAENAPLTPSAAAYAPADAPVFYPIILDRKLIGERLRALGFDEAWLKKKLASEKLGSYGDIFLALCESGGEIQFYPKDE